MSILPQRIYHVYINQCCCFCPSGFVHFFVVVAALPICPAEFFSNAFLFSWFTEDGGYSKWSDWSACDVTCGGGVMQRYRTCDSPAPSNGGRDCATKGLGPTMESKACSLVACPRKSRGFMCYFRGITCCEDENVSCSGSLCGVIRRVSRENRSHNTNKTSQTFLFCQIFKTTKTS